MHRSKGFTIVELLVVIVVIAILAAISIVSYTSVQESAQTAKMKANFRSIEQSLTIYKFDNGVWPVCNTSAYSECYLEDIAAQPGVNGMPAISTSATVRNYVVDNSQERWAVRFQKNDGTWCKMGVNMVDSWWGSAPRCW